MTITSASNLGNALPGIDAQLWQAAHSQVAVGLDDTLRLLKVTGPDAAGYLHSRTTQDILALEDGEGTWAALLDKGAHVLSYFSLHRVENDFWLMVPTLAMAETMTQLTKYRITEAVEFQPVGGYVYQVSGAEAPALLKTLTGLTYNSLPDLGITQIPMGQWADNLIIRRGLIRGTEGWLLGVPVPPAPQWPDDLPVLTPAIMSVITLENGTPEWGSDITPSYLLPETGLDTASVSRTKGCYLGQETIARVKTYGSLQKQLTGLVFESPINTHAFTYPSPGHPVVLASGITLGHYGRVGVSPTLGRTIAMAYLNKTHRTPGQVLTLDVNGQSINATVTSLPFVGGSLKTDTSTDAATQQIHALLTRYAQVDETDTEAINEIADALADILQQHRQLPDALEALGVLRSRQGRFAEAITLMEQLLALDPNRVMAHTNMSIYWLKLGDKDKAEDEKAKATVLAMRLKMQQAQAAGNLTPVTDEAAQQQAMAHQQQVKERITLFINALQQYPDDPLGNYGLASAYMELQDYLAAIPYFEKALQLQPNHSVAYLSLGKCLENTQQWVRAKQTYTNGLEVAARRGDQIPLADMQQRLERLNAF
jgi:folate-binding protein YgfZ